MPPKFKLGDRVRRIAPIVPIHMRQGVIIQIMPPDSVSSEFEYEVDFDLVTAIFEESQLALTGDSLIN